MAYMAIAFLQCKTYGRFLPGIEKIQELFLPFPLWVSKMFLFSKTQRKNGCRSRTNLFTDQNFFSVAGLAFTGYVSRGIFFRKVEFHYFWPIVAYCFWNMFSNSLLFVSFYSVGYLNSVACRNSKNGQGMGYIFGFFCRQS